jgi:hypothetical protein
MVGGRRKAGYSAVYRSNESAPLIKMFIKHLSEGDFRPTNFTN